METVPSIELAMTRVAEFAEVVCGDRDLLRAEFDAIIATSWDQPTPPARWRPTPWPGPPPLRRTRGSSSAGRSSGRQHHPPGEGRSRQRAPPPGRR